MTIALTILRSVAGAALVGWATVGVIECELDTMLRVAALERTMARDPVYGYLSLAWWQEWREAWLLGGACCGAAIGARARFPSEVK